ncbi:unnamed protein product, partial [Meganyctiphanes norvegica]
MYSFQAKVDEIRLLEDNKKIFKFFKYVGMYLVKHDAGQFRVSFARLFISKVLWMLWHLIGSVLAVWVWQNRRKAELKNIGENYEDLSNVTLFFDICVILMLYLIIGPIQSSILRYTMEAFPTILKLVKKIEDLNFESMVESRYKRIKSTKIILRRRDEFEARQQRDQMDEMEPHPVVTTLGRSLTVTHFPYIYHNGIINEKPQLERTFSDNPVINKLANKGYDGLSKIWIGLTIIIGTTSFGMVCYNAIYTDELKDEVQLVLMCFYLVFPVITTWFCIVLIEHHRNMYKVLARMKDAAFNSKDKNMLREITTYVSTLQNLFQNLSENIFEFTLGINFAIFTIISTASTYEILQNLYILQGEGSGDLFANNIAYVFPLAVCLIHIYVVCKSTHDLTTRAYDHLRIRLKDMLPELLLENDKEKEQIFKTVETLYKNLKDWPPQVCIYGGFMV